MNIRRIINQNRKQIILVILAIIFIIAIIQTLNYFAKESNQDNLNEIIEQNRHIDSDLRPAISEDSTTDLELTSKNKDVIEEFIKLCNEGKSEEAYNMLSKDCQSIMYSSYDNFYNNYYKKNFGSKKSYTIQNWINNTFKVDIKEDVLLTGGTAENNIQDFISVVTEDNQYKLNINNYIGSSEVNKETKQDNIVFKVTKKDTHMKYERYYLQITNNGDTDVLLDDLKNTNTLYLLDNNDIKYSVTNDTLTKEQIYIRKGVTMNVAIKFTNAYTYEREFKCIVFSNAKKQNNDGTYTNMEYSVNI